VVAGDEDERIAQNDFVEDAAQQLIYFGENVGGEFGSGFVPCRIGEKVLKDSESVRLGDARQIAPGVTRGDERHIRTVIAPEFVRNKDTHRVALTQIVDVAIADAGGGDGVRGGRAARGVAGEPLKENRGIGVGKCHALVCGDEVLKKIIGC